MADESKMNKWRTEEGKRVLQKQVTDKWCFVVNEDSIIYAICKRSVSQKSTT